MMRRLVEPTHTRARLFDALATLIADSRVLSGPGRRGPDRGTAAAGRKGWLSRLADRIYDWIVNALPCGHKLPGVPRERSHVAEHYPRRVERLRGETLGAAARPATGGLMISVAVPVQRYKQVLGAVMLSTGERRDRAPRCARSGSTS